MSRLKKIIAASKIDSKWGKVLTTYIPEEQKDAKNYIVYDENSNVMNVMLYPNYSQPAATIQTLDSSIQNAFEEAEKTIVNQLGNFELKRNITKDISKFNIDAKNSQTWNDYSNVKVTNENDENEDSNYNTIELHFKKSDISKIRQFLERGVDKGYISTYSITPLKNRAAKLNFSTLIASISLVDKLFNKTRLRKIASYNYENLMIQLSEHAIEDFIELVHGVAAVYLADNVKNAASASGVGFVIYYNGKYIVFGPQADQDANKIVSSNINMPIEDFVTHLEFNDYNNIKIFNSFNEAEAYILQKNNNNVKNRVVIPGYESIVDNSQPWIDLQNQLNQSQPKEDKRQQKQQDVVDNRHKIKDQIRDKKNKDENQPQEEQSEEKNEEVKPEEENKVEYMRTRIHFRPTGTAKDYIDNWIKNNSDILYNAYDRKGA